MIQIRPLLETPIFQIVNCFNQAFADYFIKFVVTQDYMQERWRGSRVDFQYSYGAYDKHKLVGFVVTGIDDWQGAKTAYNAGTGVIPDYRGQRIVAQIYKELIPSLAKAGITHSVLEVICENEKAIKAYKKAGFEITRKLHCIGGEIESTASSNSDYNFETVKKPDWKAYKKLISAYPCWDHQPMAIEIQKDDYEAINLYDKDELVAYALWKQKQGYVAQFEFKQKSYGEAILAYLAQKSPKLKMNNIDEKEKAKLELCFQLGLKPVIDQWEMYAQWD